jgi:2,4-diaminopentanoate dehydrogenase
MRAERGPVRVVQWGLGAMGSAIARLVSETSGLRLAGVIETSPAKLGRDVGELLGGAPLGLAASADAGLVLTLAAPEVTVIATGSFLPEVWPQVRAAVEAGSNVICIAEEMTYPWASDRELAQRMDELARSCGITVLGTGINPGFVLDTLVIALTGVCTRVTGVRAVRINDLSPFGPTVMRTQGVGTTPEQFAAGLADGTIVGHVGFPESIHLAARALGWEVESVVEQREPIISKTERVTPYIRVGHGMVAGCRHTAVGRMRSGETIELEHPQQVLPQAEGVATGDFITIAGTPPISLAIQPEIPGGVGTAAIAVNMIPPLLRCGPGLMTMADMPVPRALVRALARV